ncbi:unnamed protein product [Tuber aestivum]|uniref:Uncharacterized protein n=1 Tax=Tuber aestivum TaxID=59557 RepID=A0A292PZA9_9PEZI|nr:unnamed protein product [Tuber aestivum]
MPIWERLRGVAIGDAFSVEVFGGVIRVWLQGLRYWREGNSEEQKDEKDRQFPNMAGTLLAATSDLCVFQMLQQSESTLYDTGSMVPAVGATPVHKRSGNTAVKGFRKEGDWDGRFEGDLLTLYPKPRGASPCLPSNLIARERNVPLSRGQEVVSRPMKPFTVPSYIEFVFLPDARWKVCCGTPSQARETTDAPGEKTRRQESTAAPNNTHICRVEVKFNVAHQP